MNDHNRPANLVRKRTIFELKKARERVHLLTGLMIAVNNLDYVIKLIKKSKSPDDAKKVLLQKAWPAKDLTTFINSVDDPRYKLLKTGKYNLSSEQCDAILDLRLQKLTGLEREKIVQEAKELGKKINEFLSILQNKELLIQTIIQFKDYILFGFSLQRERFLIKFYNACRLLKF